MRQFTVLLTLYDVVKLLRIKTHAANTDLKDYEGPNTNRCDETDASACGVGIPFDLARRRQTDAHRQGEGSPHPAPRRAWPLGR